RQPKFLTWGTPEGLASKRPAAILARGDTVWIAHEAGLQTIQRGQVKTVPLGSGRVALHSLAEDAAGRIWTLGFDAAFVVDPHTRKAQKVVLPAGLRRMYALNPDRTGHLWITAWTGVYAAEDGQVRPVPVENLPEMGVRSDIRQSHDGRLWLSRSRA